VSHKGEGSGEVASSTSATTVTSTEGGHEESEHSEQSEESKSTEGSTTVVRGGQAGLPIISPPGLSTY
jgi:hypothetical protein